MNSKFLQLFGLKFHPFLPDIPIEGVYAAPHVDGFARRVEATVGDGGFVMITGDPGSGKSVALRVISQRLRGLRDVVVGTMDHPQSRVSDFYREVGDIFGVPFPNHNRWAGFKALRTRWDGAHQLDADAPRAHHRRSAGDANERLQRTSNSDEQGLRFSILALRRFLR